MESHRQSRNAVSSRENVKTIQTVNHVTCSHTLCCSFSITASEGSGFVCFVFLNQSYSLFWPWFTEEFTIDIWKCYSFERWVTFCPFTPHYWRRPSSKWSALSECPVYDAPHTSRVDRSKLKSGRTKTRLALCHNQKNFSPLTSLWDPQGQTLDDKRMNKQQICPLWLSLCDK